jgi:hypothetical protein
MPDNTREDRKLIEYVLDQSNLSDFAKTGVLKLIQSEITKAYDEGMQDGRKADTLTEKYGKKKMQDVHRAAQEQLLDEYGHDLKVLARENTIEAANSYALKRLEEIDRKYPWKQ